MDRNKRVSIFLTAAAIFVIAGIGLTICMGIGFITGFGNAVAEITEAGKERKKNDLTLDVFTAFPDEIDGCSCSFYLSEEDEENQKYIFVNDFVSVAFASVNGKLEQFELKKFEESKRSYLYTNGVYELEIKVTNKVYRAEKSFLEATIILTRGDKSLQKDIAGNCGC